MTRGRFNVLRKLRRIRARIRPKRWVWISLYGVAMLVFLVWGYELAHIAFKPSAAPGQVFVVLFEQNPRAVLSLDVTVYPNDPAQDEVQVSVVKGKPGRWLAVVECVSTPDSDKMKSNVTLTSYSVAQPAVAKVIEHPERGSGAKFPLGCFYSNDAGVYSIDNVTLPALGTDQAITQVPAGLPGVYASGTMLAQIFPGAQCLDQSQVGGSPGAGSPPPQSTATASAPPSTAPATAASPTDAASPSATDSPSVTPAGRASATDSPALQRGGRPRQTRPTPGPVPPPAQPPAAPSVPGCLLQQLSPGASFSEYYLPATLLTAETIEQVNWDAYTFESDYPTASYPKTGVITWNGSSVLDPSIHVSDPAGDRAVSQDTFYSGILFGLAGATGLAFVDQCEKWLEDRDAAQERKKRRRRVLTRRDRRRRQPGELRAAKATRRIRRWQSARRD